MRLITRGGHNFSGRFPIAAAAVGALPRPIIVLDGEATACDDKAVC